MPKVKKDPVIVVLGHVDHGKTSLLDNIRKTNLAKKEAGGITQSIGAWQAKLDNQKLTFIDTPGHAAFSHMRARGANVADVAVLVVAADDSVKAQTKEAIKIIQDAKIPFIVAVTKTDLVSADLEKVKADLAKENVIVEDYGGQVVMIPISNKTQSGIKELLEMIVLTYEMNPVMVDDEVEASGFVLETNFDKHKGYLVSVIVNEGHLKIGDVVVCSRSKAKIRALFNDKAKPVKQAGPGEPVQIWGFDSLPEIGDIFKVDKTKPFKKAGKTQSRLILPDKIKQQITSFDDDKVIPVFVKASTHGMLEALLASLPNEVKVIHQGIGGVTESEVSLAAGLGVEIVSLQVKTKPYILSLAKQEKVKISEYQVIYKLLEDFEKRVLKLIEPTIDQDILGEAVVLKIFNIRDKQILGCRVESGRLKLNDDLEIKRNNKIIGEAKLVDLQINQQKTDVVKKGQECGILVKTKLDLKKSDVILSYKK